ncbi:MAG: RnfABCDGE type electron transport complex subunit G [Bacteroidaceae bacterium]|nr:RnfABCDGE type electron transport complex subunit G [Bacteroidaceae bacterium]
MKKIESTWYNMAIVLTLIALIAGAALGSVNNLTKDAIAAIGEKKLAEGITKVLNAPEVTVEKQDTIAATDGKSVAVIYRTDKGVAVKAQDNNAFSGLLTVLVGFDADGNILGYEILESSETPGLGAKASQWFQKGQKGDIIGMCPGKNDMKVSKDGGEVDAITASTITSRAFLRAINVAYSVLQDPSADVQSGATLQTGQEQSNEAVNKE